MLYCACWLLCPSCAFTHCSERKEAFALSQRDRRLTDGACIHIELVHIDYDLYARDVLSARVEDCGVCALTRPNYYSLALARPMKLRPLVPLFTSLAMSVLLQACRT